MNSIRYRFVQHKYDELTDTMRSGPIVSTSRHPSLLKSQFQGGETENTGLSLNKDEDMVRDDEHDGDGDSDWDRIVDGIMEETEIWQEEEERKVRDKHRQYYVRQEDRKVGDALRDVLEEHHRTKLCIPQAYWDSNKTKVKKHGEGPAFMCQQCPHAVLCRRFSFATLSVVPEVQIPPGGKGSKDRA